MSKRLIVVHNGSSGSAIPSRQLKVSCEKAGFSVVKMILLDDKLGQKLRPHLKRYSYVAAVGGDGTISAVAQYVAGTPAVLVPIPGGTLNHFTKDLGISQEIDTALREAYHATPRRIDSASANDITFINNSSIGLYPQSLRTRKVTEGVLGKWPAATYGVIRAFMRYRTYHISIDNHSFDTPFIFVGNGEYHLTDNSVDGRNSLDAGVLSVYIVRSNSRLALVRLFCRALLGTLHNDHEFVHFTTTSLTIATRRTKISVSHDGEVSQLTNPITYQVCPKSLWITAPK